jgi:hypothetical protein
MVKRDQITNIGIAGSPGLCDRVGANNFFVQDNNPGGQSNVTTNITSLTSLVIGTKAHMTYTLERNGFDVTGSRYVNGVLTNTDRKTFIGSNTIDNAYTMQLMNSSVGSIYIMRFYNRALSSIEVKQNYLATKTRFTI